MRRMGAWVIAMAILAGGAGAGEAQSVRGVVRDEVTGAPVPEAAVSTVDRLDRVIETVLTDVRGRYALAVPQGVSFYLRIQALGYGMYRTEWLEGDDVGDRVVDADIRPDPIELGRVVVTADQIERWLRLQLGVSPAALGGTVVAGEELAELAKPGRDLVDVLRWAGLPGAFVYRRLGSLCVVTRGLDCAPVSLNDVPLTREDMSWISPYDLAAVVFLRDSDASALFPANRRGRRGAGRVMLYTKGYVPFGIFSRR